MKDYCDIISDSPFIKRVVFNVSIALTFGLGWHMNKFNNESPFGILQFICFLIGFVLLDRYAYWIYKNSVKKNNKNK